MVSSFQGGIIYAETFIIIVKKRVGVNEVRAVLFPSVSYFVSLEIDPYIKSVA